MESPLCPDDVRVSVTSPDPSAPSPCPEPDHLQKIAYLTQGGGKGMQLKEQKKVSIKYYNSYRWYIRVILIQITIFAVISTPALISTPPHISQIIELVFLNMSVKASFIAEILAF